MTIHEQGLTPELIREGPFEFLTGVPCNRIMDAFIKQRSKDREWTKAHYVRSLIADAIEREMQEVSR